MVKKILENLKTTLVGIILVGTACYNYYKNIITFDQFMILLTTASGFIFSKDVDNKDTNKEHNIQ